MRILSTKDEDTTSVCYKYPCRAMVKVGTIYGCGSSLSLSLNEGDTIEMRFANTLNNTSTIFPTMKVQYPGLKKGSLFIADAEQRLKIGSGGEFVIYDYEVVKGGK